MSKPGMVTVMQNGSPVLRVLSKCKGDQVFTLAEEIRQIDDLAGASLEDVYLMAEWASFGCMDCLVVTNGDEMLYLGGESEPMSWLHIDDPDTHPGADSCTFSVVVYLDGD
jgi:hypothetical protein